MGRVVVTEFVSLDGVYEDPGGSEGTKHAGWTFTFDRGADGDAFKLAELEAASSQLLGRVTYDGFASAWPTMTDDAGFADKMNGMRKYVVSTSLQTAGWSNSTIIRGNLAEAIPAIKAEETGDILVAGSGRLVRALMAENLVDEFRLMVFPVVLGSGRRLFDDAATTRLTLVGSQEVGSDGVTILTYSPA
jgi:dihydrofolate reductase